MAKTTTLTRIGVLSCGKLMGAIYAAMGLVIGAIYALVFLMVGGAALSGGDEEGLMAIAFGGGAIICAPLLYGVMGFIAGLLMAFLYNLFAGIMGGMEFTLEE